jgi:hypothetical protein
MFEGVVERKRVQPHFTLLDDTLVILEDVFDWVLKGNDMLFEIGIDMFNHCGKGG